MNTEQTELYDFLVEEMHATEDEINLVLCLNGTSMEVLESILYAKTGYRNLNQILESENSI